MTSPSGGMTAGTSTPSGADRVVAASRVSAARWEAELALGYVQRRNRTILAHRAHRGPLTVQRPFYPEAGGVCHTYVLHPPAGIVGGDALHVGVTVDAGAHALITTPAATRFYWSDAVDACLDQHVTVADGGTVEWLPQETLCFPGAHARTATRVELTGRARFVGWEILGLGRPACGEVFDRGRLDARIELTLDGRPLLLDRLRSGAHGVPGMQGNAAIATMLLTPADATALSTARTILDDGPTLAAATLLGPLLAIRALAPRCEPLLALCTRLWVALRPLVLDRAGVVPRIWNT